MKHVLIGFLVLGLILTATLPQTVVAEQYGGTVVRQVGANATNGSEYLEGVANKIMIVLGIVGGVVIAVMWFFVALEFFSTDPQKKAQAKDHALWAGVGTIIIVMAVGGIIWMLASWIAGV